MHRDGFYVFADVPPSPTSAEWTLAALRHDVEIELKGVPGPDVSGTFNAVYELEEYEMEYQRLQMDPSMLPPWLPAARLGNRLEGIWVRDEAREWSQLVGHVLVGALCDLTGGVLVAPASEQVIDNVGDFVKQALDDEYLRIF